MIKVGHLVPVTIIKALPDFDSYLTLVAGTEVTAILPKRYAGRTFRVGDSTFAAVFVMGESRILLSQKSPQYFRRLTELLVAPLLLDGRVRVRRAASISQSGFAKVSVESHTRDDPVKLCLTLLRRSRQYTDDTITLVRHSVNVEEYVVNALVPAPADRVREVIYFQHMGQADVFVDPACLGLFLGKKGANVATASKLTGVAINIRQR